MWSYFQSSFFAESHMTATITETASIVPILIGGKGSQPNIETYGNVYNPSTGEGIGRGPFGGAKGGDAAAEAASKAFVSWSNTPGMKRAAIPFRDPELVHPYADA